MQTLINTIYTYIYHCQLWVLLKKENLWFNSFNKQAQKNPRFLKWTYLNCPQSPNYVLTLPGEPKAKSKYWTGFRASKVWSWTFVKCTLYTIGLELIQMEIPQQLSFPFHVWQYLCCFQVRKDNLSNHSRPRPDKATINMARVRSNILLD